jgi:hypothetical protein
MGHWLTPPLIKVYEALGCLADGRLEVDGNSAKCFSSSRGKFYTVSYDPATKAIMANDNGSYWKGYLGYPEIAFLMQCGELPYEKKFADALTGIAWKDINTKFKNDFSKTEKFVEELAAERGIEQTGLREFAESVLEQINTANFAHFGPKTKPPSGY